MNMTIFPEDVTNVVQSFCMANAGDEATQALVLSIGAELLDISQDKMLEMIGRDVVSNKSSETKIPNSPRMSKLQKVKWIRDKTGADLKTCKDALEYANWELPRALDYIKYGW